MPSEPTPATAPSWAAIASRGPASPPKAAAKPPASPKAPETPATPEPAKAPEAKAPEAEKTGFDVAAIDAMPQDERTALLGNYLYPRIAEHNQKHCPGKLTGMLLELPTAEIVRILEAPEALAEAVASAVAVLPAPVPEAASPAAKKTLTLDPDSPNCVMESSWADADDDDEDDELPAVGDMLLAAGARRAPRPAPLDRVPDRPPIVPRAEMKRQNSQAAGLDQAPAQCNFDWAHWLEQAPAEVSAFIVERLQESRPHGVQAVVELLGTPAALRLLADSESVQAAGGMVVAETGKARARLHLPPRTAASRRPPVAPPGAPRRLRARLSPAARAGAHAWRRLPQAAARRDVPAGGGAARDAAAHQGGGQGAQEDAGEQAAHQAGQPALAAVAAEGAAERVHCVSARLVGAPRRVARRCCIERGRAGGAV